MNKKTAISAMAILLMINIAAAFILPWSQPTKEEQFKNLYNEKVSPLNTPQNIKLISGQMDSQKLQTIKVHVLNLDKDFYIINGAGTTLTPPKKVDKTFNLYSEQVETITRMLKDSRIDTLEQWQLFFILRGA